MKPVSELNLIQIGEIHKTHGYQGETVIKLSIDFEQLKKTEHLFFLIDGNYVPFFFSYNPKPYKKSGMLAKFDNLDSDTEIEKLLKTQIYTEEDNITVYEDEEIIIPENFKVYNRNEYIGTSGETELIPLNPLLSVYSEEGKEILIPVNDVFLKEINYKNKTITFDLPDGLTDLND